MTGSQRRLAMALCVVLALSAFLSSACLAHEAAHPHDCPGEGCPVCHFMAQLETLCRGLGLILAALCVAGAAPVSLRGRHIRAGSALPALATPVARKTRLND